MMKKLGIAFLALCTLMLLGTIIKSAWAQSGPFGLDPLLQSPTVGFGTHPRKPLSNAPTNIYDKPTYYFAASSTPAAASLCEIEAGPSLRVRVRRLCFASGTAATGAAATITIQRTTAAGAATALTYAASGGITIADPADPAFSGIIRGAGTAGTAGQTIDVRASPVVTTTLTAHLPVTQCVNYDDGLFKSPIIPPGVTNGISVNLSAAGTTPVAATASCSGAITEEVY